MCGGCSRGWRSCGRLRYPARQIARTDERLEVGYLLAQLDQSKTFENFIAATQFLRCKPGTSDRLGVMGFCCRGAIANRLAAELPDLAAAAA
jgi:dienelactone hydrolase